METAGSFVRAARQHAGLSQAELGRRAGVTQSVISAYESGTRQPSMPTLTRIVEAAGAELDVRVRYSAEATWPAGAFARRVRDHRSEILAVLARRGLTNPRLFCSVARGEEKAGSDIDLSSMSPLALVCSTWLDAKPTSKLCWALPWTSFQRAT